MSIARQYGLTHLAKPVPKKERPRKVDPLVEARTEVRALQSKVNKQTDEITRLKRELAKRQ